MERLVKQLSPAIIRAVHGLAHKVRTAGCYHFPAVPFYRPLVTKEDLKPLGALADHLGLVNFTAEVSALWGRHLSGFVDGMEPPGLRETLAKVAGDLCNQKALTHGRALGFNKKTLALVDQASGPVLRNIRPDIISQVRDILDLDLVLEEDR